MTLKEKINISIWVWKSTGNSVGSSIWMCVRNSVRDSVWNLVRISVEVSTRNSVQPSIAKKLSAYDLNRKK